MNCITNIFWFFNSTPPPRIEDPKQFFLLYFINFTTDFYENLEKNILKIFKLISEKKFTITKNSFTDLLYFPFNSLYFNIFPPKTWILVFCKTNVIPLHVEEKWFSLR